MEVTAATTSNPTRDTDYNCVWYCLLFFVSIPEKKRLYLVSVLEKSRVQSTRVNKYVFVIAMFLIYDSTYEYKELNHAQIC